MTTPLTLTVTELAGAPGLPLLVVGPSLGTSVEGLWGHCAALLGDEFHVVGWDLPGHGRGAPATGFDVPALATAVRRVVDGLTTGTWHYAGDSVGGAVGLQLAADSPAGLGSVTALCTGALIGTAEGWRERAAVVRAGGTGELLAATPARWFGSALAADAPARERLIADLAAADDESYAAVCGALAAHDLRARLHEIAVPVSAVAGADDAAVALATVREIAVGVQHGRLTVLPGVGHVAPAETPEAVAQLIRESSALSVDSLDVAEVRARGMRVRREVLGAEHVDRATAARTPFSADFQDMITRYAWGDVWTRPGLDRRSRSLITLTALIARGHDDEFAMHVRAARTNGVTVEEISELILQSAIYCGVPAANTAFRIAAQVLGDEALGDEAVGGGATDVPDAAPED